MIKKVVVLILATQFLTSCLLKKEPITIGVNSWPPCEIWYIAEEMGYFENLEVELVRFSSWSDNMENFYLGKTDISHATYFNALFYSEKGIDAKIILSADTIEGGDGLVISEENETISDLKNKKVAVEINTDEHFLLIKALETANLTQNDITIIPTTSSKAAELFIKGEVSACLTYEPYLSQAANNGNGRIVWTTMDDPGYMIDVLVGNNNTIMKRPKDMQIIINAWYKAQEYIQNNPEEAFVLMAKNENMDIDIFADFYNSFHMFTIEENSQIFNDINFSNKLEEMNDFLFLNSAVSQDTDIENIYTSEFVDN